MNKCVFGIFGASTFLNQYDSKSKDIKKAASIYNDFCISKKEMVKISKQYWPLFLKYVEDRIEDYKWADKTVKTHLHNVIYATYKNMLNPKIKIKTEFDGKYKPSKYFTL